jgi:hypothetical protein
MRKLPSELGGLFYDGIDANGLLYWFEALKYKIDQEVNYKKLILKGLGYKDV